MNVYVVKVWTFEDTDKAKKNSTYIFDIFKNEDDAKIWVKELNEMFLRTNQPKISWFDCYPVR